LIEKVKILMGFPIALELRIDTSSHGDHWGVSLRGAGGMPLLTDSRGTKDILVRKIL
jgi:hypothetical protein